jgi:hypothetical protein
MIDIVIPLNDGSRLQDIELRYCLRSIEKHLEGFNKIILVGERPEWIQNVHHIQFHENKSNHKRAENIHGKIQRALKFISGDFLFFNDDHFLLKDIDADLFPYYHRGVVRTEGIMVTNQPQYIQTTNTQILFNKPVIDFDVHCPIIYNKQRFGRIFDHLVWPDYGFLIKSTYCNKLNIEGISCTDLKFKGAMERYHILDCIAGREWFSVGDRTLQGGDMLKVLEELYPNKSYFEL